MKHKVRFTTWYWGNYCYSKSGKNLPKGFELYDEEKHGWKNSEEFQVYGKERNDWGDPIMIDYYVKSEFYQSWLKENK